MDGPKPGLRVVLAGQFDPFWVKMGSKWSIFWGVLAPKWLFFGHFGGKLKGLKNGHFWTFPGFSRDGALFFKGIFQKWPKITILEKWLFLGFSGKNPLLVGGLSGFLRFFAVTKMSNFARIWGVFRPSLKILRIFWVARAGKKYGGLWDPGLGQVEAPGLGVWCPPKGGFTWPEPGDPRIRKPGL